MNDLLAMLIQFRANASGAAHSQACHAIRDVRRAMVAKTEAGRVAALERAYASFRIAARNV